MRTLNKITNLFIGLTFLLGISSCTESPLSDVEISDPSILHVSAYIQQDFDNKKQVIIQVEDKKHAYVDLLNGGVSVNGEDCDIKRSSYSGLGFDKAYVYAPSFNEDEFRIKISYNSDHSYTLIIKAPYFPGFMTNKRITHVDYRHIDNKISRTHTFTGAPFHDREIEFKYNIMREESEMIKN